MEQASMFPGGEAHARTSDPDTSHAAAASVGDLSASQSMVLNVLRGCQPATAALLTARYHEVWQAQAGVYAGVGAIARQTDSGIRTRLKELVTAGLVIDTTLRWPTSTGRKAIVWATPDYQGTLT